MAKHATSTSYIVMAIERDRDDFDGLPVFNEYGGNSEGYYKKKGGSSGNDDEIILIENEIEDEIINELTGKAKCLYKLLAENGTDYIKNILNKFKDDSEFNINIVSQDKVFSTKTGDEINGKTWPPINNIITIAISTSNTNKHSALEGARTILHEYIHADIFRKLNTKYSTIDDLDFQRTYNAYGTQHEAMRALYVSSMSNALKHFLKNVLKDDYNKYTAYFEEIPSDAFYEALAWRALKEHKVKAFTELSSERQEEINNLAMRVDFLTPTVNCKD